MIHTYIRVYIHTYKLTYIHVYIRTYILTYVCAYIRTYVHTYIHTHVDTHIQILIIYTHTLPSAIAVAASPTSPPFLLFGFEERVKSSLREAIIIFIELNSFFVTNSFTILCEGGVADMII